ncbi:MAG: hypothetical protein JAY64_19380, partial [Candidatus Thiodiazotropha weberae]|nr:hypothetical protein [Candidatus Thiodiazotropha lotti]MCW4213321.1 hypothetical protein [Candidatus Thiodiazotropha lotti]
TLLTVAFIEAGVIIGIGYITQRNWIHGCSDIQSGVCLSVVENAAAYSLALIMGSLLPPGLKVSKIRFGYYSEFTFTRLYSTAIP